jgi:hypothetical protein
VAHHERLPVRQEATPARRRPRQLLLVLLACAFSLDCACDAYATIATSLTPWCAPQGVLRRQLN